MTEAIGIHLDDTRKLGKRPAVDKPHLSFGDFTVTVPAHPIADPAPQLLWPMDKNDVAGDCVVAGVDHSLQAILTQLTGTYTNWTPDQILAYYQTQNPGFASWADAGGPNDNGMVIQDFLAYLVKQGIILGFARVSLANEDEVKAAIYIGLAIITGEDLQVAQQNQATWDYQPSADWGGHCTTWVGYPGSPDTDSCVTWGQLVGMTQAFVQHQVTEAWFVLTKAHMDHPEFRNHFDLAGFAAAYTQITGRPFPEPIPAPTPVPPAPTPTPVPPAPTPVDPDESLDDTLAKTALPWVSHRHLGANKVMAKELRTWLVANGYAAQHAAEFDELDEDDAPAYPAESVITPLDTTGI